MKIKLLCLALVVSFSAFGELFNLPQLTPAQTTPVLNTLGSLLFFRPVEPATGYGKIWGIGVGVSAGATSTAGISSVVTGLSGSYLPAGEINLGVTVPMGITIEGGILPTFTYQSSSIGKTSIGAKWQMNKVLFTTLPVDVAVRFGLTNASLSYTQTSGGPTVNVSYGSTLLTANLIVSKNFVVLEPFAGIGLVNQSSTLTGTGSGTIFGTGYPAATTSTTSAGAALWMHAGVLLNLQILRVSASVDYAFDLVSFNGKVGFSI
jgi:hypothetical protein